MIKVAVCGANGKMGQEVVKAVTSAEDMKLVAKIDIVNANLKTVGNETGTIAQSGIIAFIHDIDSCASIITRFRDYSYPNNRDESMNIIKKADKGYMVDLSENAVVFYVADAA